MPERRGLIGVCQWGGRVIEPAARWGGRVDQLVEQLTLNQRVHGSSPCAPTNEINLFWAGLIHVGTRSALPGFNGASLKPGQRGTLWSPTRRRTPRTHDVG